MSAAEKAWIGLGSNIQGPVANVQAGLDALAALALTDLVRASTLYRNPPMGPADQPDYVNAVAELVTWLTPHELLRECQAIESRFGRERGGQRWGPRPLDLDILIYGNYWFQETDLRIPHPGVPERAFVLYPLAEIAPTLEIPGHGRADTLAAALDAGDLEPIPAPDADG